MKYRDDKEIENVLRASLAFAIRWDAVVPDKKLSKEILQGGKLKGLKYIFGDTFAVIYQELRLPPEKYFDFAKIFFEEIEV